MASDVAEAADQSADRAIERMRLACVIAHERHEGNDDLEVANYDDEESFIEYVDGGYWVEARVFVDFETVEDRMQSA